jgi:ABC-type antimicrobial peptide transport system permease subunit
MQRSIAGPRFTMTLLVIFTGLALVLAAVGLYGVMAYAVAQQTREIGIRIALGATRSAIASSVLRRGVLMAATGALVGALAARWASKLLESMLYGVGRTDPASFRHRRGSAARDGTRSVPGFPCVARWRWTL